jgi:hypothetical protein
MTDSKISLKEWIRDFSYKAKILKSILLLGKIARVEKVYGIDIDEVFPMIGDREYYELLWYLRSDKRGSLERSDEHGYPMLTFTAGVRLAPLPYKNPVETDFYREMLQKAIDGRKARGGI